MSCPNCGTAENAYFYRRGEEIVGCEHCITMMDAWEAEDE